MKISSKQKRSEIRGAYAQYVFASGSRRRGLIRRIKKLAAASLAARRELEELTGGVWMN